MLVAAIRENITGCALSCLDVKQISLTSFHYANQNQERQHPKLVENCTKIISL